MPLRFDKRETALPAEPQALPNNLKALRIELNVKNCVGIVTKINGHPNIDWALIEGGATTKATTKTCNLWIIAIQVRQSAIRGEKCK